MLENVEFVRLYGKRKETAMRKVLKLQVIIVFVVLISVCPAFAHPGGTDSSGGHHVTATGEYHFHHGYSAHQHTGGQCPYDFDDQTGISSGSGSSTLSNNYYSSNASSHSDKNPAYAFFLKHPFLSLFFAFILGYAIKNGIASAIGKR